MSMSIRDSLALTGSIEAQKEIKATLEAQELRIKALEEEAQRRRGGRPPKDEAA